MPHTNIEQLLAAGRLLEPLLPELVFVGGAVTGLLATDEAAGEPRPTIDVDVVAELTTYAAYADFCERLRSLGFREDTSEGAPICRWTQATTVLDVMPLDERVLGFTNRWYRYAIDSAKLVELAAGLTIRVIAAPVFLATKMAAFRNRGQNDFLGSRDLEDFVFVIDGRTCIVDETRCAAGEIREYLREQIQSMLETRNFHYALPGYLGPDAASQARAPIILERLHQLTRR